jgi:hypothetical protein
MRVLFIIGILLTGCEYSRESNAVYRLDSADSLVYEIAADDCFLVVYQQKIKSNKPNRIQVMIYNPDKNNLLTDARLDITIINKGRRKPLKEIDRTAPGVFEGQIEVNFTGLTTLEFEVAVTSDFKNTEMLDQEIK